MTHVPASEFKATCLSLLDRVADHAEEFTVTKYGRPVARLVPIELGDPLHGSVSTRTDDDLLSTMEHWSAESGTETDDD